MVHFDTCSVRFLSGQLLEFARCDCSHAGPCEHLALALWALQGDLGARREVDLAPLEGALQLLDELISQGVSHIGQGLGSRFREARRLLQSHAMVWPHSLLEDIEAELGYYRAASGRYRVRQLARSATSLWARQRASSRDPEVSRAALGLNLAPETSLQKVRLTGLGCRKEKDETLYYLADPGNAMVLVLPYATGRNLAGFPLCAWPAASWCRRPPTGAPMACCGWAAGLTA